MHVLVVGGSRRKSQPCQITFVLIPLLTFVAKIFTKKIIEL